MLSIAWPMIQEASGEYEGTAAIESLVPSGPQAVITVEPIPERRRSRLAEWTVPAAAGALVALGTFAVAVESTQVAEAVRPGAMNVPAVSSAARPVEPPGGEVEPAAPEVDTAVREVDPPARAVAVPAPRRQAAPVRQAPRPAAKRRSATRTKGFFGRELFRIVFK